MSRTAPRDATRRARRIVVKVGSSLITRDGRLHRGVFGRITRQTAEVVEQGREVVIVTSGASALGGRALGWTEPARSIPDIQAAAAIGQIELVEIYRRRLARYGRHVGQVLVTRSGLENREHYLNARHTIATLLRLGAIPVVNENDTVATDEIRFGDNDNLAATIVNVVGADLLVILTDVAGLHVEPPVPGRPRPAVYDVVEALSPEVERAAQGSESAFGRGGMITKLQAVRSAGRSGAATVICDGRAPDVLVRVLAGEPLGTLFLPGARLAGRKHWLAFTARPRGRLELDDGAIRALRERGRSLLPAGIVSVHGRFGIGEAVSCIDGSGREIARGLVAYSSEETERIKRLATRQIAQVLGYSNGDEVIHRDDLALL